MPECRNNRHAVGKKTVEYDSFGLRQDAGVSIPSQLSLGPKSRYKNVIAESFAF